MIMFGIQKGREFSEFGCFIYFRYGQAFLSRVLLKSPLTYLISTQVNHLAMAVLLNLRNSIIKDVRIML